ncbi:MAG: hypothetical protein WC798_02315 [Candidatus Paceibacterota bacterium]|jgi:hypothetical protein
MDISRELAIEILKYLDEHSGFYFPFLVMCKEYSDEDNNFVEIEPDEWRMIKEDDKYQTFQLWENLQNLDKETLDLMSRGFIQKITNISLEFHIATLAKSYRNEWKKHLPENEKIGAYGFNEFIGGKAEGYEDCLDLIKSYIN